ncbi:UPF0353 protein [Mycolicibacterium insubricum]|jgi:Ca-activated chloride channel family protein|uniref:Uncharacterized protein n=1 Tax=Mycolicibacterium insubricum TaxID=444597 RepID=A0A1X0DI21_9MYCO|nr:VWA domain-containing protein [Mycolicibacterium insubricum]MCB0928411.1 VWA domain-containing protein [Mycobacterium sp.]MCV7080946.1 VWA domain-containing protein [Mycolicibacterium insubricum]ORA71799.1 hypothetical protein BST26_07035 [Mycolicibacterium insubricum]BBZ65577.1 UPF0353 protein [Mycolicibacterium insubricum]
MDLPLLGPVTLTGFAHPWFFLFALVAAAAVAGYLLMLRRRHRHVLRFANTELLDTVAPPSPNPRLRHLAAALTALGLVLLTVALAGPTHDVRIPRNRAIVMLVIDVSESMVARDVAPSRLEAAKAAGKRFADTLPAGINLGLVEFAGTATVLMPPTTNRHAMDAAIDKLQAQERTATGEGILTALAQIAAVSGSIGGGEGPPPMSIVLESDGKETVPADPNATRGGFTAARSAKEQGVKISAISFGTPNGTVEIQGQQIPVPVDDATLRRITEIADGRLFHAENLDELDRAYTDLRNQLGYQIVPGDASHAWVVLATVALAAATGVGLGVNRRLPG